MLKVEKDEDREISFGIATWKLLVALNSVGGVMCSEAYFCVKYKRKFRQVHTSF